MKIGDLIISINSIRLDDFDFSTSLSILQAASNRKLAIIKHSLAYEDLQHKAEAGVGVGAGPFFRSKFESVSRKVYEAAEEEVSRFGVRRRTGVGESWKNSRGWHFVCRRLMDVGHIPSRVLFGSESWQGLERSGVMA